MAFCSRVISRVLTTQNIAVVDAAALNVRALTVAANSRSLPALWRSDGSEPRIQDVKRHYTTSVDEKSSIFSKIRKGLGLKPKLKYTRGRLRVSGYRLYMCCDEFVDHEEFRKEFHMPDTFNSWFLVTELHVWMLMVRITQEGEDGNFVRQMLVRALWEDVDFRSKKLGSNVRSSSARREGVNALGEHFTASIFNYDEGILSDDKTLAGAIWRVLLEMEYRDPEVLELAVTYVRKQMKYLDEQSSDLIIRNGFVSFLPINGDKLPPNKANEVFKRLSDGGS